MFATLLVASALAQEAACPGPTHTEVMEATQDVEQAFRDAAPDRILAAARFVRQALPCVGARLFDHEVAAVHRLFAYDAFVRRDTRSAQEWFEASRAADTDSTLPPGLFPERHPIRGIFDLAAPRTRETLAVSGGRGTQVWVDGQERDGLAVGRPAIVQIVADTDVETLLILDDTIPSSLQGGARVSSGDGGQATRAMLALGVSGVSVNHDEGPWGYGGPMLRAHVLLSGPLFAEAMVQLPLTSAQVPTEAGSEAAVVGMPMTQLGIAGRGSGDGVVPWASVGALVLSDVDGIMAGAGFGVGLDVPVSSLRLTPEVRAGSTTGARLGAMPLLSLGVGVGVPL